LQDIVSPEESLDQRAALNRANAMVALADLASQNEEKRHFYHEAYYLYTLLANTADQPRGEFNSEVQFLRCYNRH